MGADPRLSFQTLQVLQAFLAGPEYALAGTDVLRQTGLASGTAYPILARLEQAGWLASEWEHSDPKQAGRPRRRYYRITGLGVRKAEDALRRIRPSAAQKLAWA
jgi:PadR family transcriptional regulator PadR